MSTGDRIGIPETLNADLLEPLFRDADPVEVDLLLVRSLIRVLDGSKVLRLSRLIPMQASAIAGLPPSRPRPEEEVVPSAYWLNLAIHQPLGSVAIYNSAWIMPGDLRHRIISNPKIPKIFTHLKPLDWVVNLPTLGQTETEEPEDMFARYHAAVKDREHDSLHPIGPGPHEPDIFTCDGVTKIIEGLRTLAG